MVIASHIDPRTNKTDSKVFNPPTEGNRQTGENPGLVMGSSSYVLSRLEGNVDTFNRLSVFDEGRLSDRINSLKCRVAVYRIQIAEGDEDSALLGRLVEKTLAELLELGCEGAVTKFREVGYWT